MVDGDPRPLPPEEQIKQDSRFSYILKVYPQFAPNVVGILKSQEEDPTGRHANFWVDYLSKYSTLCREFRRGLTIGDEEQLGEHSEAVVEWLNLTVLPCMATTDNSFFDLPRANGVALRMSNFENNPDQVDAHTERIMQTPLDLLNLKSS